MPITTPHTAIPDLQTQVYNTLIANSTFMSLVTGLFDPAPEGQAFPYVTFGEHIERNWYKLQKTDKQVRFMFHVWSQQNGYLEAYNIVDTITGIVETFTFTLTHFDQVPNGFLFEETVKQPSPDGGITRHLTATYNVYLSAK
jgi:hypothetical protein